MSQRKISRFDPHVTKLERNAHRYKIHHFPKISDIYAEIKMAARRIWKARIATTVIVISFALGTGATTAIFSLINAVLLRPLPYPDPDRIVQFKVESRGWQGAIASEATFQEWRKLNDAFSDVSAYDSRSAPLTLTAEDPEEVRGAHVTGDYFRLFGAPIILGRTFNSQEEQPQAGKAVVLSFALWQRRFSGDKQILGKSVMLDGSSYTVIGVVGRNFESIPDVDIWLPFQINPNTQDQTYHFQVAGRLNQGIKLSSANAQLKLAAGEFRREFPTTAIDGFIAQPLRDSMVHETRRPLLILFGIVCFVLLIACANVANLQMLRAISQKTEFVTRTALGATRIRIVSQLLTESIVLSLVGSLFGLVLGQVCIRFLLATAPWDIPRISQSEHAIALDWRVLVFTVILTLFTGVVFALIPSLGVLRFDLASALKSGGRGVQGRSQRVRSLLVIIEISIALTLLMGSQLLIRTYLALRSVDPGFEVKNVLTMQMALSEQRFGSGAQIGELVQTACKQLDSIPGVESSASSFTLPLERGFSIAFSEIGDSSKHQPIEGGVEWTAVSPDYLSVLRIPILVGRGFTDKDNGSAPGVAVINLSMARRYWHGENAVGQMIVTGKGMGPSFADAPRRIIGIIGDIHGDRLDKEPEPMMLVPQSQVPSTMIPLISRAAPNNWLIRANRDPHLLIRSVTDSLRRSSGGLRVAKVRTMDEIVAHSTAQQNFNMRLLSTFGGCAVVLAIVGIYGLMANYVIEREREIGVRMALGADRGSIAGMVVAHGMKLVGVGIVIGVGITWATMRLIASFLFEVKSDDLNALAISICFIAVTSLIAVWIPAKRASQLDPKDLLRSV